MKSFPVKAMCLSLRLLVAGLLLGAGALNAQTWSVTSPNGLVKISVQLADLGGKADYPKTKARLYYSVEYGREGNRAMMVNDSPLGLRLQGIDLVDGLKFIAAKEPQVITNSYQTIHGKRRQCYNTARELTLAFNNPAGQVMEIDFRAYDNGAAFRYLLPGNSTAGVKTLDSEATGFALSMDDKLWMAPNDKATTYAPGYETYYENEIAVGTPSPLGVGWEFPVLFRTADGHNWGLITEAAVETNYCGSRLSNDAPKGVYRVSLPDPAEGNGYGSVKPSSTFPWEMPWRVIIVGDSLANIVESTLVEDLCPPSRVKDTSWIRPGRVAWSWWSDQPSPKDAAKQLKFVDLAAEMGWEYVLVDANWTIIDNGSIHDVIRYAKSKGVGVLLWYNSGGPHNVVTEKPRDSLYYKEVRRFELDMLRQWGVKGIKVDFFQSDKQDVINLYWGIMQDAAEYQIMVNFHGCTVPRGWSRTYPNLMSMEAVRGEENYIFDDKYPARAPIQNTITPFTRNAVGPMDYTPMGFSNNNKPHITTSAHELALGALFETGWLHFADKAESYLGLPPVVKDYLKKLPVVWDDTRFVAGYPGRFAVLARRAGDTWYLAAVNAGDQPREEHLKLGNVIGSGNYNVVRIADGDTDRTFATETQTWDANNDFVIKMRPHGGFTATLKK